MRQMSQNEGIGRGRFAFLRRDGYLCVAGAAAKHLAFKMRTVLAHEESPDILMIDSNF